MQSGTQEGKEETRKWENRVIEGNILIIQYYQITELKFRVRPFKNTSSDRIRH